MKAIILAGGSGTRLAPMTNVLSKQILPVYDKPMINYPLSVMMNFGFDDILIISTPRDIPVIESFLGSGEELGIKISYAVQEAPKGIAEAFIIAQDFIGDDSVCLILGDNIFYGSEISGSKVSAQYSEAINLQNGAYILAYKVSDPERYGVVELDKNNSKKAISIEEKPAHPKSDWAVTGLYFYDNNVVKYARDLKPSARGELEITDINNIYLERDELNVIKEGRGFAWLDAGTPDSLLDSSNFVQTVEKRQGVKIACVEEIALNRGFIGLEQFKKLMGNYSEKTDYHKYLKRVLKEGNE